MSANVTISRPPFVVLDANVWVSFVISKDSNHTPARIWVLQHLARRGTFVIPNLFQLEVAAAITRVTKNPIQPLNEVSKLRRLNSRAIMRVIDIEDRLVQDAISIAINYGLRTGDALYAALAQYFQIPLVTFDAELLKIPSSVIVTIKP